MRYGLNVSSTGKCRVLKKIFTSLKETVLILGHKNIVPISYGGHAVIQ